MSEKEKTNYHIYGRTEYPQPLEFVKTVAQNELAEMAGEAWLELIAFPETAVIQVIPRQKEKAV
ncbi:MAG: hypothetical protein GY796_14025 [Chloroflexi bacterium]|nr:hypothetical protein [Chloroflexota bacterium]